VSSVYSKRGIEARSRKFKKLHFQLRKKRLDWLWRPQLVSLGIANDSPFVGDAPKSAIKQPFWQEKPSYTVQKEPSCMPLGAVYRHEAPPTRWARRIGPYVFAIGLSALTTWLTLRLPGIGDRPFFVLFLFATGLCAWRCGLGPSWTSSGLNVIAVTYYILLPQYQFLHKQPDDLIRLGVFGFLSFLLAWLISRLRSTQEALRLAGERFQLAYEVAKMWAWELDVLSGEVVWSTDTSRGEKVRRDSVQRLFDRVHPDDRARVTQAIKSAAESNRPYTVEFRTTTNTGQIRWLASSGEFYKTLDGRQRMIGVNIDVTARKIAEETLEAAAKAEMAAELAHQINNPLQALTHALHLLHTQVTQTSAQEYSTVAQSEVRRVSDLVRQILHLYPKSRIG
jgi:K+-sensing histidine kinase KdpD